ncbi:MAG: hypothetical protein PHF00_12625, partial [Elusimicrobia bacterium]|nr:hypothetical protein [Elusimicrobiota bacterium]
MKEEASKTPSRPAGARGRPAPPRGAGRSVGGTRTVVIRVHGLPLLPPSARKPRAVASACRRALAAETAQVRGELNVVFLDRPKMRSL